MTLTKEQEDELHEIAYEIAQITNPAADKAWARLVEFIDNNCQ